MDVAPERDLTVNWRSISLLIKNKVEPDSEYYEPVSATHNMLRVMEAMRAAGAEAAIGDLYTDLGQRIHHRQQLMDIDLAAAVAATGADRSLAEAANDASFDDAVRAETEAGLALVGEDVGTPIVAIETEPGSWQGYFGPVISPAPTGEAALRLWDNLVGLMEFPELFELKRTRNVGPIFAE
ncbi:MAG: disulfide bond formation protein DsbA [Acidimicrobiales bacterium]|nr:disulfide bond formation protein DsbA [Acidimicrobiales bacterium]